VPAVLGKVHAWSVVRLIVGYRIEHDRGKEAAFTGISGNLGALFMQRPVVQIVLRSGNVWPLCNATDERRMPHNRSIAKPLYELLIAFAPNYGRVKQHGNIRPLLRSRGTAFAD
jgi:hypothetical protein